MIHLDLFSGLGIFSYAADHVWSLEHIFCEIEDWLYRFLKQEYPDARIERDVRKFDGAEYAGRTFLLTAGVPCQPASVAGKRKGTDDDRWLWPEALRVMAEAQPEWAIFENPLGILTLEKGLVFENLLLKMENQGYSVQPYIIPACAIGAVHKRDRVWIVAHRNGVGCGNGRFEGKRVHGKEQTRNEDWECNRNAKNTKRPINGRSETKGRQAIDRDTCPTNCRQERESVFGGRGDAADTEETKCEQSRRTWSGRRRFTDDYWQKPWPEVATEFCRMDVSPTDRIHRLKALGNTIQWEVACQIMQAIKEIEEP